MTLNFFSTLDTVLTQGISGICRSFRISEEEAIRRARDYLAENSAAYYSEVPDIQYNDPLCRIAYLYAYVGAHANLVDNAFYKFIELRTYVQNIISQNGVLNVCSLGGGPGSELLGFVKFIERERQNDSRIDIDFTLIDKILQWDETWHALVNGLESTFENTYGPSRRDWPVVVQRSFLPLDLTQSGDFQHFPERFNDIDIFVINHTVSELVSYSEQFLQAFASLVRLASDNSLFLFIDRNETRILEYVDELIRECGLTHLGTHIESQNMDRDEEKTNLGKWYVLMERDPKLTWNAFFTLAQITVDEFAF